MKLPSRITIKNSPVHCPQATLMLRGETTADITATMERHPWQK